MSKPTNDSPKAKAKPFFSSKGLELTVTHKDSKITGMVARVGIDTKTFEVKGTHESAITEAWQKMEKFVESKLPK